MSISGARFLTDQLVKHQTVLCEVCST